MSNYNADLEFALDLAIAADAITIGRFLATDLRVETKPDLSPVTEADRAAEELIRNHIGERRPNDVVAGEEFGGVGPTGLPDGRVWVIDPIDGTKNYVRGVPVWATLIGLVEDSEPVVGVVSAPALGRKWWACKDGGAWTVASMLNNCEPRRIQTSAVSELADASMSISDSIGWDDRTSPGTLERLSASVWRNRAYGDFYSHILVAEGAVDIAAEPELNPWDVAALIPIVAEAGGRMTGYDGSSAITAGCGVSTNGSLHAKVLDVLR